MLTSSTSGALSRKLYGGTLDGLPDHHRTRAAFTGALTPVEEEAAWNRSSQYTTPSHQTHVLIYSCEADVDADGSEGKSITYSNA